MKDCMGAAGDPGRRASLQQRAGNVGLDGALQGQQRRLAAPWGAARAPCLQHNAAMLHILAPQGKGSPGCAPREDCSGLRAGGGGNAALGTSSWPLQSLRKKAAMATAACSCVTGTPLPRGPSWAWKLPA
jgi:hypothetical protein